MSLKKLKKEDINLWNELFKNVDQVGERDFSNFIKEFNILLNNKNRHNLMMSIIKTIKNKDQ